MIKAIKVSVDPGYNGTKVVMENGREFWYDSAVVSDRNQTLREGSMDKRQADSSIVVKQGEETYVVGAGAIGTRMGAETIRSASAIDDSLDLQGTIRYQNPNFAVLVNASVVSSIIQAAAEGDIVVDGDPDEIRVIASIALPQDHTKKAASVVADLFWNKDFSFDITIGTGETRHISLVYDHILVFSQVLLSMVGYAADDFGKFRDDFDYTFYPTLLVDCGYGTIGLCFVLENGFVSERIESNTDYAMKSVNIAVSEKLKQMGYEISEGDVDVRSRDPHKSIVRKIVMVNGKRKAEQVDVAEIRKEEVDSIAKKLSDYLYDAYKLETKGSVLVSGGTGEQYYPVLKKEICGSGVLPENRVILTQPVYHGKTYDSIYTVAVGGIKYLNGYKFEDNK